MNFDIQLFPYLCVRCGFGLLMYGFGSKKALLEDFASTALTDYSVVVINGYLQSINLKQVLSMVLLIYDLTFCMLVFYSIFV